jgi:hypothetical protein
MSKKNRPARGVGQIVQGEILPTIEIDCSESIVNPEEWTRGPVRPVTVIPSRVANKQPRAHGGKKRRRR